jgi:hypothetical protein
MNGSHGAGVHDRVDTHIDRAEKPQNATLKQISRYDEGWVSLCTKRPEAPVQSEQKLPATFPESPWMFT